MRCAQILNTILIFASGVVASVTFVASVTLITSATFSSSSFAAERWSPTDLSLATQTALSDFRNYYYDFETWKQIRSYSTINTPAGAAVQITYNDNGRKVSTTFSCRYLPAPASAGSELRMACIEH